MQEKGDFFSRNLSFAQGTNASLARNFKDIGPLPFMVSPINGDTVTSEFNAKESCKCSIIS